MALPLPRLSPRRLAFLLALLLLLSLALAAQHTLPHIHHSLRKKGLRRVGTGHRPHEGPHHHHPPARPPPPRYPPAHFKPDLDPPERPQEEGERDTLPPCPLPAAPLRSGPLPGEEEEEPWHGFERPIEEVRKVVEGTKGYFARDWSLWLGWNNIKYIIETSLNQAHLLNRTLLLPSFVYARSCEFEHDVCSSYAYSVDRSVSGSSEWDSLPPEEREGWRIPIGTMFRLPPTSPYSAIITLSEFLTLHSLPPHIERADGQFSPTTYLHPPSGNPLSLAYIPNEAYDPSSILRIDRLPPAPTKEELASRNLTLQRLLDSQQSSTHLFPWTRIRDLVHSSLPVPPPPPPGKPQNPPHTADRTLPDPVLIEKLRPYGLAPVYQFHARAVDLTKGVGVGWKGFARRGEMGGWVDEFGGDGGEDGAAGGVGEEVLWLQGEVHNARRPGSMYFHSSAARDDYARLVLQHMRFPAAVERVADRLARRMEERVGGRMWMAAHMRRGDFVTTPWTHTPQFSDHLLRVQQSLQRGRKLLTTFHAQNWTDFRLSDSVPDALPNLSWAIAGARPPEADDPFYVATDERNSTHLSLLRSSGALLLSDLLTPEDRRLLGAPALLTDYLSLVEQQLQMRAAFWTGSALTSVSGTVANGRVGRGCDMRTTVMDW